MNASTCDAWTSTIASLRAVRRAARRRDLPSMAVCLTGQLRLFMVGFPALVHHLLLPAAQSSRLDFFYVGPADASFVQGEAWVNQLPGMMASTLYSPELRWHETANAPLATLTRRLAMHNSTKQAAPAVASLNLHGLRGCRGSPISRIKSRLVQALQARECLTSIRRVELQQTAERRDGLLLNAAPRRYAAVLRLRADLVVTGHTVVPTSLSSHAVYSSLTECPTSASGTLAHHDYALLGERGVMDVLLGVLDGARATRTRICYPHPRRAP